MNIHMVPSTPYLHARSLYSNISLSDISDFVLLTNGSYNILKCAVKTMSGYFGILTCSNQKLILVFHFKFHGISIIEFVVRFIRTAGWLSTVEVVLLAEDEHDDVGILFDGA